MQYFFDNSISYRLVAMLRALDVDAVALREEYEEGIKDPALFTSLAGRDLAFVATDLRQLTREHEARGLKAAGITAIYFAPFWNKKKLWPQAEWLVRHWPTIEGFVRGAVKGTIAEIKQNGRAMTIKL